MRESKITKFLLKCIIIFILVLLTINFSISLLKDTMVSIINSDKFLLYSKNLIDRIITNISEKDFSENEKIFYRDKVIKIKKKLRDIGLSEN